MVSFKIFLCLELELLYPKSLGLGHWQRLFLTQVVVYDDCVDTPLLLPI